MEGSKAEAGCEQDNCQLSSTWPRDHLLPGFNPCNPFFGPMGRQMQQIMVIIIITFDQITANYSSNGRRRRRGATAIRANDGTTENRLISAIIFHFHQQPPPPRSTRVQHKTIGKSFFPRFLCFVAKIVLIAIYTHNTNTHTHKSAAKF